MFTLAVVLVFVVLGLADRHVDLTGQLGLGFATWLVLLAALRPLSLERRVQTLLVVGVATCMEVVGSILWGVYTYRLHNLPLFVPPGHGLVYLAGISLSETAFVRARPRAFVRAVAVCAAAWGLLGLTALPRFDLGGAIGVSVFLLFLWKGRAPAIYGGVFFVVLFLELWGTAVGLWQWHAMTPGLGLPMGNPPSGAMSGYVLFDIVAIAVTAWLLRVRRGGPRAGGLRRRVLRRALPRALGHRGRPLAMARDHAWAGAADGQSAERRDERLRAVRHRRDRGHRVAAACSARRAACASARKACSGTRIVPLTERGSGSSSRSSRSARRQAGGVRAIVKARRGKRSKACFADHEADIIGASSSSSRSP